MKVTDKENLDNNVLKMIREDKNEVLVQRLEAINDAKTLVEKFDALLKIHPFQPTGEDFFSAEEIYNCYSSLISEGERLLLTLAQMNKINQMEHYRVSPYEADLRFRFDLGDKGENEKLSKILRSSLGVNHEDEHTIYYVDGFIKIGKEHGIFTSEGFSSTFKASVRNYICYDKITDSFEIRMKGYHPDDDEKIIKILREEIQHLEDIYNAAP